MHGCLPFRSVGIIYISIFPNLAPEGDGGGDGGMTRVEVQLQGGEKTAWVKVLSCLLLD